MLPSAASRLASRATIALAAAVVLVPVGSASAVTRYAADYRTTKGMGAAPCTDAAKPCLLLTALGAATSGDEVVLSAGTYRRPGAVNLQTFQRFPYSDPVVVPEGVTLRGADPAKLPVLSVAPNAQAEPGVELGKNARIRDVAISATAADHAAITYSLLLGETALADRVRVRTTAAKDVLQVGVALGEGSLLRSSVSFGVGDAGGSVTAVSAAQPQQRSTVRNVTAVSLTPGGVGIASGTSNGENTIAITNTIARGTAVDLRVRVGTGGTGTATALVDHSNWITQLVSPGTSAVLQQTGPNQNGATAAEPGFFDAAAGDFRQVLGSPTIDAGAVDVNNGLFALGGAARHIGLTTDIGADEFDPANPPQPLVPLVEEPEQPEPEVPGPTTPSQPASGNPAPSPQSSPATPPADRAAPTLTGFTLASKVRRTKATTIRFTLSEPAEVRLQFGQPTTGRSVGGKCVKPTAKHRKAKRCIRPNVRGTLVLTGKTGANAFSFRGRLGAKQLALGRYVVTATPIDAARNTGKPATRRFTLAR